MGSPQFLNLKCASANDIVVQDRHTFLSDVTEYLFVWLAKRLEVLAQQETLLTDACLEKS